MICQTCNKESETRPYGKNGANICFDCAFASPEVEAETERNYLVQLDAAAKLGPVLIGTEAGPIPYSTPASLN